MKVPVFSIAPLPSALFLTPSLIAAEHKIRYVIQNRQGLALLLGDVGVGKSSLLRRLASDYQALPEIRLAFIPDPEVGSAFAFVRSLCGHFDIPAKRSLAAQKDALRDFVFAQAADGNNVVLMLDDAQKLTLEVLEILRGLLNFESNTSKLLQIIVAGQFELRDKLKLKSSRALKSRIVMHALLDSLTLSELTAMLRFRCECFAIPFPFTENAIAAIYAASVGVPREALNLCAAAWELAKILGESTVTTELAEQVIQQAERVYESEATES